MVGAFPDGHSALMLVAARLRHIRAREPPRQPCTELFEVLLPDGAQKYGLVEDITVGRDGLVHAPNAPGLGYEIDFALVERKKISVLK